ncbi:MAG: tetratricopeptide repeat protein [Clostridia bacterium]|nr:tetratricopeptide repeat protein [Clostridia bacterium]
MANIKAKLFGIPEIYYQGEEIKFPFKKADALFYYLLLTKKTTRDHLVNLFWADSEDNVAKKNLRNAIYIIKKHIGAEVFISPRRSMIEINPDIEISLDVDLFLAPQQNLSAYQGSLLEGLNLKGCENFENWLMTQRQYYEGLYIQKTLRLAEDKFEQKAYNEVESLCKKLMKIDPFDEEVYRMLMEAYYHSGRYDKSLSIFEELVKLLDDELAISPDAETYALYEKIIQRRSQQKKQEKKVQSDFFYGREQLLNQLFQNYNHYLSNQPYAHYLLQGEIGIGKTALMNALIHQLDDVEVVRVFCYQAIEGFNLKAWDDLIEKLGVIVDKEHIEIPEFVKRAIVSTFPSFEKQGADIQTRNNDEHIFRKRTVENAIYELIKIVTREVKLLLVFEDIQWLDEPSLIMLKKLVNERYVENPVVYMTCRNAHHESIEKFISEFSSRDIIKRFILPRFTEKETFEFVKHYEALDEKNLKHIYEETEGNPFFIMEMIKSIRAGEDHHGLTPKMKDAFKHRLLNISKESLQVIQLASVYHKRFTVEDIVSISEKSEFEVLDLIEELEHMYLIKEEVDEENNAVYNFTHSKIKTYIYNDLSLSKRKILHSRIAKRLEELPYTSRNDYSRLVYHYTQGNQVLKALEYRIKNLYEYLQSSHEVFPLIKERDVFNHESIFFSEAEIEEEFQKIEEELSRLNQDKMSNELIDLKLKFKHMTGRHYINNGMYEKGLNSISEVIEIADGEANVEYLIKGYLQNIFYSINTHNLGMMYENITIAFAYAEENNLAFEKGILLRLKGLYLVLQSNFEEGEELLLKSIQIMKQFKDKDKYTLNIAAAYYYMGDSNRFKGDFSEAIKYYEKAIEICENNDLLGRLTLFYTNAGHSAYDLGDYLLAQRYFESALKLYEQLDFPWRRSIAYGFLGLLHVKNNKFDKALELFEMANKYSAKMNNPYELAVVCRIKAELETMLLEGNIFSKKLQDFIESEGMNFVEVGIHHLRNFTGCYEMKRLNELKIKRQLL